ncbi:MAG: hypothetical protein Q8O74_07195, partial [bacterium]|nr:hypothetical protein [bacterium]
MRKIILLTLLVAGHALAQQWSPAINLMPSDPGSSWTASNQAHSLAIRGDTVYLVWYNSTWGLVNMGHQIYYKKYDGTAWGAVNILVNDTLNYRRHSWYPSCALDAAGNLHVVWEANDFGQISSYDIAYRRLSSNGSWSGVTRVTSNVVQGYSWRPVIA